MIVISTGPKPVDYGKTRRNGCQLPLHIFQLLAIGVFLLLVAFYYTLLYPVFRLNSTFQYIQLYFFLAVSTLTSVIVLVLLLLDPRDPLSPLVPELDLPDEVIEGRRNIEAPNSRWCQYCVKCVNETSKHCRTCNKCVIGFDHHCVWLNTCIGSRNYRIFIISLLSLISVLAY